MAALRLIRSALGFLFFASCAHIHQDASASWYEVVHFAPGPAVSDPGMRTKIEQSGLPWKVRDRATGIEMLLIMPGEFLMGSPESEPGRKADEGPQHRVRITQPYYLGSAEVTQAQWTRFMELPQTFVAGHDIPVTPSWDGVQSYLAKANASLTQSSHPLRLPTEAEWEYACRAGTIGAYNFAGPIEQSLVNFNDGEVKRSVVVDGKLEIEWTRPPSESCPMSITAVAMLPPNAWGLHDMHGSLWEWCFDWNSPHGYPATESVRVDPVVTLDVDGRRILRGGSWYDTARYQRAAARDSGGPHVESQRIGVRFARSASRHP
jgi:formylglycine-generating enzyme required for sulfatase activity